MNKTDRNPVDSPTPLALKKKARAKPLPRFKPTITEALSDALFEQIALERSHTAFEEFYDLLAPKARAVAMRVLGNMEESRDIVQEVFVQFWEKAPEFFQYHTNSTAWIVMLSRRRAIDETRSSRFRKSESYVSGVHDIPLDEPVEDDQTPEAMQARFREALVVLTPGQRKVMDLVLAGKAYREIGELLKMSEDAVKKSVFDANQKLRPVLADGEIVPHGEPKVKPARPAFDDIPDVSRSRRDTLLATIGDSAEELQTESPNEQDALLAELEQYLQNHSS